VADPVVIEMDSADGIVAAAARLRELGYSSLEAYTPFPIPELDEVLEVPRTKLPWLVLFAGGSGTLFAFLVIWWTNGFDYPIDVGGRPLNSFPTDIPIMFETTVLLASLTAFGAALVLSGLPRLHHRLFEIDGFERTTVDRFWIIVGDLRALGESRPTEEIALLRRELGEIGPVAIRGAGEAAR
jgi:hypothetical protein